MAAEKSSAPSCFNLLKEGLLLPTHNRRLFAAVFAIVITSTSLNLLGSYLAVEPLTDKIRIDTKALNSTEPGSPAYLHLSQEIQDDTRALWITNDVRLLVSFIIGSAIQIVVHFAAVATHSGEVHHTLWSLLGKAKAQLKGPVLTIAVVTALEMAAGATLFLVATMVVLFVGALLMIMTNQDSLSAMLFVGTSLSAVVFVLLACFSFLCSLSIVVAVAEPGCHGAGALARAWRLMKGKHLRAMLFILVANVLSFAFRPVHKRATACAGSNMAAALFLGVLYAILTAALEVFAVCAKTAFYYECKESTEASATMEYIKVSTKEKLIDA